MNLKVLPLLLLLSTPGMAQTPVQVKDINTNLTGGSWQWPFISDFIEMEGVVYFQASDGIHGTELWRSDGTEAGTRLVRDICPGACSSWIVHKAVHGSMLYFGADDGAHGRELWKSDGTEEGTVLVKELVPGLAGSSPSDMFGLGGELYFTAFQQATGRELWKSDGSEAGTMLVQDLSPGPSSSSPRFLARIGSTAFLSAGDAAHGTELWKLDELLPGLTLVKDIEPGPVGSLYDGWGDFQGYRPFAVLGNRLFFIAYNSTHGGELWKSDGTEAGTTLVKDINPGINGSSPASLVELDGRILFRANDGASGSELWRSDGTEENTGRIKDIWPGSGPSYPWELTAVGGWIYFHANDGTHGNELWKSDGTEEATVLVKDLLPGSGHGFQPWYPNGFNRVGTTLLFFANDGIRGWEPWRSDGTEASTTLLADLNPGSGSSMLPYSVLFSNVNGRWYFHAFDEEGDIDVYTSDGTPAGTQQLAEINDQASAFEISSTLGIIYDPYPLVDASGTLFFQASDGISGQELWKSDGTEAGTEALADIFPGAESSRPSEITALGDRVLFSAEESFSQSSKLWTSDGTQAGTGLLKNLAPTGSPEGSPSELTRAGSQVYFTIGQGIGLWKSDGTEAGTVPVQPAVASQPGVSALTGVGSLLFYSGGGPNGVELWRTDGSAAGTVQVKNIAPGTASSSPDRITPVGSRLFFSADDGSSGRELWVSDGTGPGTFRVKDIAAGGGSALMYTWNDTLFYGWAVVGSRVFFVANDGTTGDELWVSDGTESGTILVGDIRPGALSSEIGRLVAVGSLVFFAADDGTHGRELWVSDGTENGTRMLADLVPGEGSSLPDQFAAVGRNLVFAAHTPDHGLEPWITDGSLVGTRRLADIAPGATPSSPQSFTLSGDSLYFVATDGETGFELYSVPRTSVDGGMDFHTLTPCRLFDTRQIYGALESDIPRQFPVAGTCGIPESAQALAVNVTALGSTSKGNLLLYRAGIEIPGVSTVNFAAGQIRSNNTLIHLGAGAFEGIANLPDGGQVHLIVDVSGYYE